MTLILVTFSILQTQGHDQQRADTGHLRDYGIPQQGREQQAAKREMAP